MGEIPILRRVWEEKAMRIEIFEMDGRYNEFFITLNYLLGRTILTST